MRLAEEGNGVADKSTTEDDYTKDESKASSDGSQTLEYIPSRTKVLQACTVTCGLITALGVTIRQVWYSYPVWPILILTFGEFVLNCEFETCFSDTFLFLVQKK